MHTIINTATSTCNLKASASFEKDTIVQCPSCDIKLHRYEVAKHCEQELQRLKELQPHVLAETCTQTENKSGTNEEAAHSTSNDQSLPEKRKPWSVFQRVQRNRQCRMKQRHRKRPTVPEHQCPVCNQQFSQDEIQQHVEDCLRQSRRTANGRRNMMNIK
ncbi:hypothetical protein EVAR_72223_1 [Eumeta japonica]|uniref:E3 ubiquitin-protein ligase RNF220 middle domain-containing protein n=1 Tax=Eumeta variegata TaxID=151549 RepID=A0A4C1TRV4_EUMVA|nr:hypothetical protein EVAR_72223_1 [Eumeta japonica]